MRALCASETNYKFSSLLFMHGLVRMSRDRSCSKKFRLLEVSNQHFDLRGLKMKVFSRRENEGLVIGHDVSVTVLQIRSGHVRLAISCPRLTPAYWEETLFWSAEEEEPSGLQLTAARS
jgi:carbon storage regulator CsrA